MLKKFSTKQLMILFGCFMLQAVPYVLSSFVPPLYFDPIERVYPNGAAGFTTLNLTLYLTIGAVASALVSPIVGKFFGKAKTKIIMYAGLAVAIVGMIIQATATNVYMFWVANIIIQSGCITFIGLAIPYLIGNWFGDSLRATAMGIAFAGGSFGNIFAQFIFTSLFQKVDSVQSLRQVFWIITIVFAVVGLLIITFCIKDNKEDQTPNHDIDEQKVESNKADANVKGCGFDHTKSMSQFWIMGVAMIIIGLNIAAQSGLFNKFFSEMEINKDVVKTVGSVFAIACVFGNVVGGALFSKLGTFKTLAIGGGFQIISAITMFFIAFSGKGNDINNNLPFLWAVLYGLSTFTFTQGPSTIIQSLFGLKDFGQTVGIFNIFFAVGFAIGAPIFAAIQGKFDVQVAWISVVAFAVIGYLTMLFNVKIVEPQKLAQK